MIDPQNISHHDGNVWTAPAHRQNKTGGRSVELSPRRRRFWNTSTMRYARAHYSRFDSRIGFGQPASCFGSGDDE